MKRTKLHLLWRDDTQRKRFRTGVSLHSHTLHSEESLAFVPRYTAGLPVVGWAIRQQEKRCLALTGRPLDFSRAFWRGDEPWPVKMFVYGLHAAKSQQVRSALRLALADAQEVSV